VGEGAGAAGLRDEIGSAADERAVAVVAVEQGQGGEDPSDSGANES